MRDVVQHRIDRGVPAAVAGVVPLASGVADRARDYNPDGDCRLHSSTLHQSSLGALFLIVPEKMWSITYSPLLPLYFLISAVAVGLAMTIVESTLSARAFQRSLEAPIITSLARAIPVVIIVLLTIRVIDMTIRGTWVHLAPRPFQTFTFLLHMTLLLIPTFVLLNPRCVQRPRIVFWAALSVVAAVIVNRLNVAWFRMLPSAESIYIPSWQEVVVTLNLISAGVVCFGLAARYLPLFQHEPLHNHHTQPAAGPPAPGGQEFAGHAAS